MNTKFGDPLKNPTRHRNGYEPTVHDLYSFAAYWSCSTGLCLGIERWNINAPSATVCIQTKYKKGCEQQLTAHLNTIDTTGNIKFTYEEESEGSLPFLHTLMVRREDGTIKLLVYRKKTHTDQYLNFSSHHPLHQKLGVIKTLLDRCNNIVTDPEDRRKEEEYISKALQECGYPKWTIRKIREKQQNQQRKSKEKNKEKSRCMVTLPYVQGVTEPLQRIHKHHDITSAVSPHRNLRKYWCIQKTKWKTNTSPIVCTKSHVRHAICVTLVKQEEHLVPDLKNIKKKWKQ